MKRSQRRQMQEAIKEIPFAVFCLDTEKMTTHPNWQKP